MKKLWVSSLLIFLFFATPLSAHYYDKPWLGAAVRSQTIHDTKAMNGDDPDLFYYAARYYDPGLGRFITPDSITPGLDSQSLNLYAYCNNNPVSLKDPTGKKPEPGNAKSSLENEAYILGTRGWEGLSVAVHSIKSGNCWMFDYARNFMAGAMRDGGTLPPSVIIDQLYNAYKENCAMEEIDTKGLSLYQAAEKWSDRVDPIANTEYISLIYIDKDEGHPQDSTFVFSPCFQGEEKRSSFWLISEYQKMCGHDPKYSIHTHHKLSLSVDPSQVDLNASASYDFIGFFVTNHDRNIGYYAPVGRNVFKTTIVRKIWTLPNLLLNPPDPFHVIKCNDTYDPDKGWQKYGDVKKPY